MKAITFREHWDAVCKRQQEKAREKGRGDWRHDDPRFPPEEAFEEAVDLDFYVTRDRPIPESVPDHLHQSLAFLYLEKVWRIQNYLNRIGEELHDMGMIRETLLSFPGMKWEGE